MKSKPRPETRARNAQMRQYNRRVKRYFNAIMFLGAVVVVSLVAVDDLVHPDSSVATPPGTGPGRCDFHSLLPCGPDTHAHLRNVEPHDRSRPVFNHRSEHRRDRSFGGDDAKAFAAATVGKSKAGLKRDARPAFFEDAL